MIDFQQFYARAIGRGVSAGVSAKRELGRCASWLQGRPSRAAQASSATSAPPRPRATTPGGGSRDSRPLRHHKSVWRVSTCA